MVCAATAFWNNVVDGQITEWELSPATVATALLLAQQDVLVLVVRYRRVDVGASQWCTKSRHWSNLGRH